MEVPFEEGVHPKGLFGYRAFLQLILHRIRTDPWKSPNIDPRN